MSIIIRTIHLHKPYFLHGLVTQSCQVFTNLKVFLVLSVVEYLAGLRAWRFVYMFFIS